MKKKRGPKSEPVDKLRTLATLSAIDRLCPDVLAMEERNKIWRWRKTEVAMSANSMRLLCNRIARAAHLGGPEVARQIEHAYLIGPDSLPMWEAFDPADGHDVAIYFAEESGIDCKALSPAHAAAAVFKSPVPPLWKLAAATSAVIHFHRPKIGETSIQGDVDEHALLIAALRLSSDSLDNIGLDPQLWASATLDQIEYFPSYIHHPRLVFEKGIFPALN